MNAFFSKYMGWRAAALKNQTPLLISSKNLQSEVKSFSGV